MNHTIATILSTTLVSAGVLAELNLIRIFVNDWREGLRDAARRRLRPAIIGRAKDAAHSSASSCRGTVVAALVCGVMPSVALAQAPATLPAASEASSQAASASSGEQPSVEQQTQPAVGSAISVQLNVDFTNAYFYRGIRQQDKGLIVQPAARLTTRLVDDADFKMDGFIGTWNSLGPNGGARSGGAGALVEAWYESDLYAGFTLTHGKLSLTTSYTFLTSPSDAFQSVQELGFTLALDDSEWMKAHSLEDYSLKPYATLAIETGSNGSDGPDLDNGTYLEFGIAPGFSLDVGKTPVTLTFPASVGLSLSDYYQDAGGSDDTFGFAQFSESVDPPRGAGSLRCMDSQRGRVGALPRRPHQGVQ
ncbi:MAG: hypothetical protein K2W85_01405 [Phycisphaerales bacterium]|nr:hypothetical protein [Phycisphaerales bacterium]